MKLHAFLAAFATSALASPFFRPGAVNHEDVPVTSSVNTQTVPDNYIVFLKEHVSGRGADAHQSWLKSLANNYRLELRKRSDDSKVYSGLKHTYDINGAVLGYSGHFDPETVDEIRRHPDVAHIELDSVVSILESPEPVTQENCPWGLARISHRKKLSFDTFSEYLYAESAGEGVDVYVIDTGTFIDHADFGGRAKWGATIPQGDADTDGNGHGTHASGSAVGTKFGVAKKSNLYAVKVLRSNGSGTMSDVIKGVEWVVKAHLEKAAEAKAGKVKGFKGSVANMSLGGGKATALDRIVNAAVDAGVHFAVAAGNDNADACPYSPAAAEKAVTVGASTLGDERAYFSNYGPCVDIFAPGHNIQSAWVGSKYATNTISGTSMASPHIAGLLATYLALQPEADSSYYVEAITPAKLKDALISVATEDVLKKVPSDTPNLLAWNGGGNSDFADIVSRGGYKAKKGKSTPSKPHGSIASDVTEILDEAKRQIEELSRTIVESLD